MPKPARTYRSVRAGCKMKTIMDKEVQCQSCKQEFVIALADFDFYRKMDTPPPTFCPECRFIRRLVFMNERTLYKRPCDRCGKEVVSLHAPGKKRIVYCQPCWWADDWDGTEYGRAYDPSRPFLEQVRELMERTPYMALESDYLTLENSEYASYCSRLKNCYLVFFADYCERVLYSSFLANVRDSADCYRMKECDLSYGTVGGYRSSRTFYCEEVSDSHDMYFSRNCTGCSDCFGCSNLRNKSYHIWNVPYSKEEYQKRMAGLNLHSFESVTRFIAEARKHWLKYPERAVRGNSLNVDVSGEYVYESKNTHDSFMVSGAVDSRFCQFITLAPDKDAYDSTGWGAGAERIYEAAVVGGGAYDIRFSNECWPGALDIEYSMYAIGSKHCFGCVNLKRKDYAILNWQYDPEEYALLKDEIIYQMEKNPYFDSKNRSYRYGEFFPAEFSPFAYNETDAMWYFPISRYDVVKQGYRWSEIPTNSYTPTISTEAIPDDIRQATEKILQEILPCSSCGKAFRIVADEFALLKQFGLPLPRTCPECRHRERFARVNPPKLWDRRCDNCQKAIKTSFAPERPETIYCADCYTQEVSG